MQCVDDAVEYPMETIHEGAADAVGEEERRRRRRRRCDIILPLKCSVLDSNFWPITTF